MTSCQVFMYFPGGRVDRCDSYAKYTGELSIAYRNDIGDSISLPAKHRALVLASIRETYEETSLMIGRK